jgi:chromosome partitioning protein
MKVLAIANQKGGCGKTTVAINLSSCLSMQGKKTLLVDMDPQGHCALGLAVPEEQIEKNIHDVLSGTDEKNVAIGQIVWQIGKNFDLAPSNVELAAFEQEFAGVAGRELRLKTILDTVAEKYDYCIIDCPPAVSLLTFNALMAADGVIIPVETGYFSVHGLSKQLETLNLLQQQCNRQFTVKVLANLYDVRTKLGREMLGDLRKRFGEIMFQSYVNFNTKIREGASLGQAISEYDPASSGFKDFNKLSIEIIKTFEKEAQPITSMKIEATQIRDDLMAKADELSKRAEALLQESTSVLGQEPTAVQNADTEKKLDLVYGVTKTDGALKFIAHYPEAKQVAVAGDFNNWSAVATPMSRIEGDRFGDWEATVPVTAGRYRYRLIVDDIWQQDPHNDYVESNPYGELNSVVEV